MKLLIATIFLISTLATAHSGRTDSSGGHYNRSTGEYHSHNSGYSKPSSPSFFDSLIDKYFDYSDEPVRYFSIKIPACVGKSWQRAICQQDIKNGKYIKGCEKDQLCRTWHPNNLRSR